MQKTYMPVNKFQTCSTALVGVHETRRSRLTKLSVPQEKNRNS